MDEADTTDAFDSKNQNEEEGWNRTQSMKIDASYFEKSSITIGESFEHEATSFLDDDKN